MKTSVLTNHKPALIAALIAIGLIAALSTFASGGRQRSGGPECYPGRQPSFQPSARSSSTPTERPTARPSTQPNPTCAPGTYPTMQPTENPGRPGNNPRGNQLKTSWESRGNKFTQCFMIGRRGPCETSSSRRSVFSDRNYQANYQTNRLKQGTYNLKLNYRNVPLRKGYKVPKDYKYKVNVLVNGKLAQRVELKSDQRGGRHEHIVRNLNLSEGSSQITVQYVNDYFVKNKFDAGLEVGKLGLKKRSR